MDHDRLLRDHLVVLLRGGNAHMGFAAAVANVSYTVWHLLEHLRLTQADILEYVTSAAYRARDWPRDYWPAQDAQATKADWDETVAAFRQDLDALITLVLDDATDLFGPVPNSNEHTFIREVLIVADHNAYHIGELGILRQIEDAWGQSHEA